MWGRGAGDLLDSKENCQVGALPTCARKTWVTTLVLAWLCPRLPRLSSCWNLPRGLPRCRHSQPSGSGFFVTVGKCFCFPTSGSINSTNEQNSAVRLIVSSGEPPAAPGKCFPFRFLAPWRMCVSLEHGGTRPRAGSVAGEESFAVNIWVLPFGWQHSRNVSQGLEASGAFCARLRSEGLDASCLAYAMCPDMLKHLN